MWTWNIQQTHLHGRDMYPALRLHKMTAIPRLDEQQEINIISIK